MERCCGMKPGLELSENARSFSNSFGTSFGPVLVKTGHRITRTYKFASQGVRTVAGCAYAFLERELGGELSSLVRRAVVHKVISRLRSNPDKTTVEQMLNTESWVEMFTDKPVKDGRVDFSDETYAVYDVRLKSVGSLEASRPIYIGYATRQTLEKRATISWIRRFCPFLKAEGKEVVVTLRTPHCLTKPQAILETAVCRVLHLTHYPTGLNTVPMKLRGDVSFQSSEQICNPDHVTLMEGLRVSSIQADVIRRSRVYFSDAGTPHFLALEDMQMLGSWRDSAALTIHETDVGDRTQASVGVGTHKG